jgi:phosphatidylserine decarboxylase
MKIAKAGWPFILGCFIVGSMLAGVGKILHSVWPIWGTAVAYLGALYCAYFFRDPKRVIPTGDRLILSPADGKILEIVEQKEAGSEGPIVLIRIFLSIFDPHIQRAPVAGTIRTIRYTEGKFLDARHEQAHFENEQNRLELVPKNGGTPIAITQIAGLIARRIVCWVKEGQTLQAGEQYGLIRFGSQVDITFPASAKVLVKGGDRVEAGATILAEL